MKINIGILGKVVKKKFIMPILGLLSVVAVVAVLVTFVRACVTVNEHNLIDLDMLEPDGSINQKEMFRDVIEGDRESKGRYQRKDAF
ncbi:MAG: hypothetical protein LBT84_07275 [Spirochaetia bacterium]|nr:hypothetical protein [Spirochaetia bacterium]